MDANPDQASERSRVHIFGIRHHGPGSARSLKAALDALQPDALLIEGPPDANEVLALAVSEAMQPPVALLIYAPDEPTFAAYYPFAEYSPEWQAIRWGITHGVPVRMNDLAQSIQMAMTRAMLPAGNRPADAGNSPAEAENRPTEPPAPGNSAAADEADSQSDDPPVEEMDAGEAPAGASPADETPAGLDFSDPLRLLAEAAGYSDSEQWWEHLVEERRAPADLFSAILEAMTALREVAPVETHPIAARREAAMRQGLRAALGEGFQRIAVVCGAWHTPALVDLSTIEEDARLLSGLPVMEVRATWVPWTNARLTRQSGYGAGIDSPGWYGHLWSTGADVVPRWLIRAAQLLRSEDVDISPAHVIEAVRLAEALAALRERPLPGLAELNEAALTVFCAGNPLPMRLIEDRLIVGDRLGCVPPETPMAPLQQDFERETRRLKMVPEAYEKLLDLDLRKTLDLERSYLLHRLNLLDITWGKTDTAALQGTGKGRSGTFHEIWRLKWQPELAVMLIEAGQWGSTITEAATARVCRAAALAPDLVSLTRLVEDVLLAELPAAIPPVMSCLQAQAAASSDMRHLMQALPPLASVLRYGNVRQTDTSMIAAVVAGLAARVCIGLPGACSALNEDAATEMFELLLKVDEAINRLDSADYRQDWQKALSRLVDLPGVHGLLAGRACRVLHDTGLFTTAETARRLSLALSTANEPLQAAAWIEGFLRGSGQLLVHDDDLLGVINDWLSGLAEEVFTQLLPLLRRTFATFAAPERRSIGERVKRGQALAAMGVVETSPDFDPARADAVLPLAALLLGISRTPPGPDTGER